jgi:SGNH domain (fused to AT3 domains)
MCAAVTLAVAAPGLTIAGPPLQDAFFPAEHPDARDVPGDPLDIRAVTFGQRDTQMWLKLRTQGKWSAGELVDDALCVSLVRVRAAGRVCVGSDGHGAPIIRFHPVAGAARRIAAALVREDERSVFASFSPRAIGLPYGRVRWFVESHWERGDACMAGCDDRVPDEGYDRATISALAQPRCFGAAARAPGHPCDNPALRTAVIPSPSEAAYSPDSVCRPYPGVSRAGVLRPCEFGDLDTSQGESAALIGDSHSAHWRAAVDVVAQARGWRAVSITRPGCAFSTDVYPAPAPTPANCRRLSDGALRWLATHPGIHTVFTSSSAGRGLSAGGFLAMWRRVPSTVHRIYVIRDVPRASLSTAGCAASVLRHHRPSKGACAVPRGAAIIPDPSAQAAGQAPSRVRLIDLTHFFCDATRCFPIIGGAYVYRDDNHMNSVFSTSLGPFLLRALG